ncbi:retrovirus-related pol polyprotein from transposon TNT 1-94 [Tanacetum coccineum]|uniref:Retrovirus-related pol polyprotein from transposon TNT 1-94 n=1 Tax=Tanacetum coccineum TaxID=301880 RepID=A0ABQ5AY43_9ASTR
MPYLSSSSDSEVIKQDIQVGEITIGELRKKLEKVQKDKDGIQFNVEKFENASKSLDKLIESQIVDNCIKGLGYNAVPPPYTGNFMPPKPDLSFIGLDEFVNETAVENCKAMSSKEDPKVIRKNDGAPIIEEWVSDSEEENVTQTKTDMKTDKPSIDKIEFVKPKQQEKTAGKTVKQVEKHRQNTHILRGNQINWNNMMSQRLGSNFKMFNKACYVCGSFDHLQGNPQIDLQDQGVIDSGCSRHMTGNMSYLTYYEEIDGGYVAFGGNPKGGKITGKGTIKTGNLDFENVYFVRELKFNLFSVSQMCDKKNSVLFNDTECIVLSPNFKLIDESQVLLRVPRKNNMYSVDLKNIVPKGGLTCLFAKATSDESKLWHRRLGHLNFKTMNKLVKGNLVRGLPSKLFENDQTCVACQKGKQHRASCKSKTENSISLPLHLLHMYLFGPTFVKSLMKKIYCLVVTDDYSRFTWVKVIRYDNGTEFKNREMNQFCEMKCILRQFSVARTPQQNGVVEMRNRTLIEAARTMLVDFMFPTTFWAEAVNSTCYVQNRVLVVKPYNKTPYELFHGRTPILSFMRPFGCPVTILNTIDHLGKFNGKADEGFFVRYSLNSKAFRVFNSRTRIVEENLHIRFSENTPNVVGSRPAWLFDIDALTKIMNYEQIVAGTQSNDFVGTKASDNADDGSKPLSDDGKKIDEDPSKNSKCQDQEKEDNVNSTNNVNVASTNEVNDVGGKISIELPIDPNMPTLKDYSIFDSSRDDEDDGAEADMNNLDTKIQVSPNPTTRIHKDHPLEQEESKKVIYALKDPSWIEAMHEELLQFKLQEVWTLVDLPNGKRAIGTKWVFKNKKDERGIVIRNKARLVTQGAFLYGKIEEELYVCQPSGFEDLDFPDRVDKVKKALHKDDILLVQVYVDDIIFGSTKKKLCITFEKLMHEKFQMSSMGELTFFLGLQVKQKKDGIFISQDKYVVAILKKFKFTEVKTASTPMETQKPLLKDEDGEEVDVHMYRSIFGSLMYLTSSRPDIMFAVCACARYQVNPKVSHLHAVKRIFRYLKGQPKLGLWYPKDSPFDLVAYTDSDYVGGSLDRKSTIGGCQFLGCRLISWQCKKQTVVANSTTEAEYAKTVNGEVQLQALVDGKKIIITESTMRRDLQLEDAEGVDCLPNATIFEQLALMGYEQVSQKLTFYKAFFSPQWKFLIHTVLQCLSPKTTA